MIYICMCVYIYIYLIAVKHSGTSTTMKKGFFHVQPNQEKHIQLVRLRKHIQRTAKMIKLSSEGQ